MTKCSRTRVEKCRGWKIFKALKFYFIVDMLTTLFAYFTRNMMQFYFSTTSTLDTPTLIMFYSAHVVVYIGFLNSQISVVFLVSFLLVSRLRAGELSEPLGFLVSSPWRDIT